MQEKINLIKFFKGDININVKLKLKKLFRHGTQLSILGFLIITVVFSPVYFLPISATNLPNNLQISKNTNKNFDKKTTSYSANNSKNVLFNSSSNYHTGTNKHILQYYNNRKLNANLKANSYQNISGVPTSNSITVNETADLTYIHNNVDTANTYNSVANTTYYTYNNTGYTSNSSTFDVSNITATNGINNVENNGGTAPSSSISTQSKNSFRAVATSFNIYNNEENITQLRLYFISTGIPSGKVFITGNSGGLPNSTIYGNNSTITNGFGWVNITYSKPLTLTKGSYFVVVNDTGSNSDTTNYYTFYYVSDSIKRNMWYINDLSSIWSQYSGDLMFQYSYLVLNDTNISVPHVYSSPSLVNMYYNNNNAVTSLLHNYFDYSNDIMQFTTNVSVTFSIKQHASIFLTTPPKTSVSYFIGNNTFSNWNVSFTDNSFPSTSFSISNRSFTLNNLPNSWNATKILENLALFDKIPFTSKIQYNNGSTVLSINSSTDSNGYVWTIEFQSLNYVDGLNLNNGKNMSYPYAVNSTDTLSVIGTMLSGVTNGYNGTIELYDYTNKIIYSQTNVVSSADNLPFASISLSSSININNPNGTYTVTVEWLDSAQTEIGFYELSFIIISQTSLAIPPDIPDTIVGQNVSLTVAYENYLNNSVVNGATIVANSSWTTTEIYLNNTNSHDNYTGLINTAAAHSGINTITITASLKNYVLQELSVSFNVINDTSLTVITNETVAHYSDNIYFNISYYDISGNAFISNGNVTVNGIQALKNGNFYYYIYNTSLANPALQSLSFVIKANKTFDLSQTNTTNIPLQSIPTNFIISPYYANMSSISEPFTSNNSDNLTYTFAYNDTLHNRLISDAILTTNITSSFSISGNGTGLGTNGNWIITIYPIQTGIFPILFTFSKGGYLPVSYILVITITTPSPSTSSSSSTSSTSSVSSSSSSQPSTSSSSYSSSSPSSLNKIGVINENYFVLILGIILIGLASFVIWRSGIPQNIKNKRVEKLKTELSNYGAPNNDTLNRIKKGNFISYEEYTKAKSLGVTTRHEYQLLMNEIDQVQEFLTALQPGLQTTLTQIEKRLKIPVSNLNKIILYLLSKEPGFGEYHAEIETFIRKEVNINVSGDEFSRFLKEMEEKKNNR